MMKAMRGWWLTVALCLLPIAGHAYPPWVRWHESQLKPWTPAKQTGRIACWDPNVASTVTPTSGGLADGSLVLSIADAVGGNTLTRFTGGYEPTYKINIVRGNAALLYAGATQSMRTASDVMASQGQWTVIVVEQGVSIGATATVFTLFNAANSYVTFLGNTNTPSSRVQNGVLATNGSDKNVGSSWIGNSLHVLYQRNGGTHATHTILQDRSLLATTDGTNTADPGTTSRQHQFFLGSTAGIVSPFAGYFFYVEVVDHPLSTTEWANYETYFEGRFATP